MTHQRERGGPRRGYVGLGLGQAVAVRPDGVQLGAGVAVLVDLGMADGAGLTAVGVITASGNAVTKTWTFTETTSVLRPVCGWS
jgi:hypothetical protein